MKAALRSVAHLTVFSDVGSFLRHRRAAHHSSKGNGNCEPVPVRIRPLLGRAINIRPHGTDASVLFYTFFHRFHLPPQPVARGKLRLILDFGANIGCTMAHFACLYPDATVIGVELDRENAELCRKNIAPWGDRCQLIEGAVWTTDGQMEYEKIDDADDGYSVIPRTGAKPGPMRSAQTISINSIIRQWCPDREIDYIKMDIEGAEQAVLQTNTEWAAHVRSMNVEIHRDYTAAECVRDLERLGFKAWQSAEHPYCVVAVKNS
jgi:FkbM family methyltransferase